MFVGKESNSSKWKQWGIGFVDNTLSSVEQSISGWFWNLINDLPRDYFAKTFDQVNYFDQSIWEGIFRARIEDIKEQLESGVSKKTFEADIIKLQGLIGKHSLSPLAYEDGLKELEDFVSYSNNHGKHLQLLANVRNEFREELRAQPLLLKECIKNDTNLGQREVAYYQSLLDSPSSASSKEAPVQPSALGKSIVRKNGVTNSKLRNISKLLLGSPAQAITLFLAAQAAFVSASGMRPNNSSVGNSTLPFSTSAFNASEVKQDVFFESSISKYNNSAKDNGTDVSVSNLSFTSSNSTSSLHKVQEESTELKTIEDLPSSFLMKLGGYSEVVTKNSILDFDYENDVPKYGSTYQNNSDISVSNLSLTSDYFKPPSDKVEMENVTLKAVEEPKVLESEPDYEVTTENSTLPSSNKFLSKSEMNNTVLQHNDTFAKSPVHSFSGNSTLMAEENVMVNTEDSIFSAIIFTEAFNDKIEKVKNDILIIALTQVELNESTETSVQRFKRSVSTNNSVTTSSSGVLTHPNPSNKVTKLEDEVRKMKEGIAQLKQSFTISSGDKERLANLETSVENLQKLLDNQSKEFAQKTASLESDIENLIKEVNGLRKELGNMKNKAAEQEKIQKQQGLPDECIKAIKSHDFKVAERKLQEINDDIKINFIIKEVYNYQIGNFDLVLKFGDSIGNIKRSFLVYKALNYEIESNGHKDPFKMIKLIESLRKKIINQPNTSSEVKGEAESLVSNLKNTIKAVAKGRLVDAMANNSYHSSQNKDLANSILNFDSALFRDLIREVVGGVYSQPNLKKIIELISNHSYFFQIGAGFIAILDNMQEKNDLNQEAMFTLAYELKKNMGYSNYGILRSEVKADFEKLKNRLPSGVRDIVFSSKLCILDQYGNKFLYASDSFGDVTFFTKRRRKVFGHGNMSDNGSSEYPGLWKIERDDNNGFFVIKNNHYNKKLYMADPSHNYRAYVWDHEDDDVHNKGQWKIIPRGGNKFQVKNNYHDNMCLSYGLLGGEGIERLGPAAGGTIVTVLSLGIVDQRTIGGIENENLLLGKNCDSSDDLIIKDCNSLRKKRNTAEELKKLNIRSNSHFTEAKIEDLKEPSSHISDVILEKVKTTDKNIYFTGR